MDNIANKQLAHNHVSVDCVLIGFDGEKLNVLLIKRAIGDLTDLNNMKLPGGLTYMDEELGDAASRVLIEHTGLQNLNLIQFKTFGSKDRTKNPKDVLWLERAVDSKIERIITVGYLATVRLDKKLQNEAQKHNAIWTNIDQIGELAFDHNTIINEALQYVRYLVGMNLSYLFDLLPPKFTVAQLRILLGIVNNKTYDIKNFHKKLPQMPYLIPLEEKEKGVAHRAAKYYKFDGKQYVKMHK